MATDNFELMDQSRRALKGKWGLAIGGFLVYMLVTVVMQVIARMIPPAGLAAFIIAGPIAVGLHTFSLAISRNKDPRISQIFDGFNKFGVALGAYLLMILFILLWALLLIIPGIIAALSYSMTFYIVADDPNVGAMEALNRSKKMMDGYKWKYFCLCLWFLLLAILCLLTLGIGFFWLYPYMTVTMAKFYDDINGGVMPSSGDVADLPLDARMD